MPRRSAAPAPPFAIGQKVWALMHPPLGATTPPHIAAWVVVEVSAKGLGVIDAEAWRAVTENPRGLAALNGRTPLRVAPGETFPRGVSADVDHAVETLNAAMARAHAEYHATLTKLTQYAATQAVPAAEAKDVPTS